MEINRSVLTALLLLGKKSGEVKMIKNGDLVEAHQVRQRSGNLNGTLNNYIVVGQYLRSLAKDR